MFGPRPPPQSFSAALGLAQSLSARSFGRCCRCPCGLLGLLGCIREGLHPPRGRPPTEWLVITDGDDRARVRLVVRCGIMALLADSPFRTAKHREVIFSKCVAEDVGHGCDDTVMCSSKHLQ